MRRVLMSTLLALILLLGLTGSAVADTSLGVSPSSIDVTLAINESVVEEFYIYYFTGTLTVEVVGVPITVSPSTFVIPSSPTLITLTLTNTAPSTGVYEGYLKFTRTDNTSTALAIQVGLNINVTADVIGPAIGGAGGGGGGGGGASGLTNLYDIITPSGRITQDMCAPSDDGEVELCISRNTIILSKTGKPTHRVIIRRTEEQPDNPEDAHIIGFTYDMSPDGTTFNPSAKLIFSYDSSQVPADVDERDLVLAFYDEESEKWVILECEVNIEAGTITAMISHFTVFVALAVESEPVTVLEPVVSDNATAELDLPIAVILPDQPTPEPIPVIVPTPIVEPEPRDSGLNWGFILIIIGVCSAAIALAIVVVIRRYRGKQV